MKKVTWSEVKKIINDFNYEFLPANKKVRLLYSRRLLDFLDSKGFTLRRIFNNNLKGSYKMYLLGIRPSYLLIDSTTPNYLTYGSLGTAKREGYEVFELVFDYDNPASQRTITRKEETKKVDDPNFCSCASPNWILNVANNQTFKYCKTCKKELK